MGPTDSHVSKAGKLHSWNLVTCQVRIACLRTAPTRYISFLCNKRQRRTCLFLYIFRRRAKGPSFQPFFAGIWTEFQSFVRFYLRSLSDLTPIHQKSIDLSFFPGFFSFRNGYFRLGFLHLEMQIERAKSGFE